MDEIRTLPLTRQQIGEFINSERGVRSYEDMQGDIVDQYEALTTASFLTLSSEPSLGSERALTIGVGLSGVDDGPNNPYTLSLSDTAVIPGIYGGTDKLVSFTVDAKGRITNASQTTFSSDNVPEGGVNLYFTNARARNAVSAGSGLAYNVSMGVFSLVAPVSIANGGTGASTAATARLNLGLASMATQQASNVAITGGVVSGLSDLTTTGTVGVGGAPSGLGGGVSFPATQSASADPNTLDDYEEGSWTPTVTALSGSLTSYIAGGTYTKIGRLVVATVTIGITDNGTGAQGLLVTLPFTNNSGFNHFGAGREIATTFAMLQAYCATGTDEATVLAYDNTYPGGTGNTVQFTIAYTV